YTLNTMTALNFNNISFRKLRHLISRKKWLLYTGCWALLTVGCSAEKEASPHFQTRGIVLDTNDLSTVDWPKRAKEAGLTTIATLITPQQVSEFIQSERGQRFLAECAEYGIQVEHELHAMADLLPRELFNEDSTMLRVNE